MSISQAVRPATALAAVWFLLVSTTGWAEPVDTSVIEAPWPKQRVHDTEVGRHAVRWRERASKQDGIFAGVTFSAPLDQQAVWDLSNEYQDVGKITPGVTAVRYLERSETHERIAVDMKILWKSVTLVFDVDKDPPNAVRFRLVNEAFGEYRGICKYAPQAGASNGHPATAVELATWFQPSRPVPMRMLLFVERVTLLQGARKFLDACDERRAADQRAPAR